MNSSGISQEIQQWVRIALYLFWGALGNYGANVSQDRKALIASILGAACTVAWTVWGSKLTNLLERVKASSGVEQVEVKVNPDMLKPAQITRETSPGISAIPVAERSASEYGGPNAKL
jgi:hypothetical protein